MDAWLLWLIAAVILALGEIATLGFVLAPFAGGALLTALVAGMGGGIVVQLAVFLLVSIGLLGALRPLARSHKRMPALLRTGTAALVGQTGLVTERVANDVGSGAVKIEGEVWTARAYDDDAVIEAGVRVSVVEIKGAIALVTE